MKYRVFQSLITDNTLNRCQYELFSNPKNSERKTGIMLVNNVTGKCSSVFVIYFVLIKVTKDKKGLKCFILNV